MRLNDPRLALFLMVAGDATGNSFMPVYARGLYASGGPVFNGFVSEAVATGLPVSIFWLAVAVTQLTTGLWERGRDHRTLFGVAILLSTVAVGMCGLAGNVAELAVWRAIGGLGYGAAMILAQDAIIRAMGPQARTLASGAYLSAFFSGAIIGTLAGSTLAEPLGFGGTLIAGAFVSAVGAALTRTFASHRESLPPQRLRPGVLLRNRPLLGLVLLAALPSRLINGGFVFCLLPLYLHQLGTPPATIGWIAMIYALIQATTTTFWSRLIDRTGRSFLFTVVGVTLSGLAMLVIPGGWSGVWGVVAAVTLLGIAQSIGMSPQITVLFAIARPDMERFGRTTILGIYRVCERAGLFIGPMAMAWCADRWGNDTALAVFGSVALAAALGLTVAALLGAYPEGGPSVPVREPEEAL